MASPKDRFDAAASALGYAYQWRSGLLLLLRGMRENLGCRLTIERIDDLSLEADTAQLFQTKRHQPGAGSLSDASEDVWKTLRVWSTRIADGTLDPLTTSFALVTTTEAPDESAAFLLRAMSRNPEAAEKRLIATASSSTSTANRAAYDSFLALDPSKRAAMLANTYVLDGHEDIEEIGKSIEQEVLFAAEAQHLASFRERLEGWWFDRVIVHLLDDDRSPIEAEELNVKIGDLREQYHRDSLPIDFILAEPDTVDAKSDARLFVSQLRLIAVNNSRIESAIRDYYRAFEQRSRWIREDLLHIGELDAYERRLIEEWQRYRAVLEDELGLETEAEKVEFGRRFYRWIELEAKFPIRPRCEEPYVMRGSFQILADGSRVGWHPEFLARLQQVMVAAK
jgi:hypothetical protein